MTPAYCIELTRDGDSVICEWPDGIPAIFRTHLEAETYAGLLTQDPDYEGVTLDILNANTHYSPEFCTRCLQDHD